MRAATGTDTMPELPPIPPELSPEDIRRACALLPRYADGSIDSLDSIWLADWLTAHQVQVPEMITELHWLCQTHKKNQHHTPARALATNPNIDSLLTRPPLGDNTSVATLQAQALHSLPATTPTTPAAKPQLTHPAAPTWWMTLQTSLRHFYSKQRLATVFVIGFALQILLIAATVTWRSSQAQQARQQVLPPITRDVIAPAGSVLLNISFLPDSSEQAIRSQLTTAHATIIAGPTALGIYTLSVPADKATIALQTLQHAETLHHVVDTVQRAP